MNTTLKFALKYIEEGLFLIPLYGIKEGKCTCPKGANCNSPGKHPKTQNGLKDASNDEAQAKQWFGVNCNNNIGIVTGKKSGLFVLDVDKKSGGLETLSLLENEFGQLPPTYDVYTGGLGRHFYLKYPTSKELRNKTGFKPGLDLRGTDGYVVAPPSNHISGNVYYSIGDFEKSIVADCPEWLMKIIEHPDSKEIILTPNTSITNTKSINQSKRIIEGQRNTTLFNLGQRVAKLGLSAQAVFIALQKENEIKCSPPLDESEIRTITESVFKKTYAILEKPSMEKEAYYGILGDICNFIIPYTETSSEAILLHLLIFIGNIVGRCSYLTFGPSKMFLNEFGIIIGDSAKARKGTALLVSKYLVDGKVGKTWKKKNLVHGVSTGEGIIERITDEVIGKKMTDKGIEVTCIVVPAVEDKRILIIETEFSKTLRLAKKDHSILKDIFRQAFDGEDLETVTKQNSRKATNPHVSLIGHITVEEFKNLITDVDAQNGFLNRFLFCHSERTKKIPFPCDYSTLDRTLINRLIEIIDWISAIKERSISLSVEAQELWESYYSELEQVTQNNLDDSMEARLSTHTLKIASIFALIDMQFIISPEHLRAAYAIAKYSRSSSRFVLHKDDNLKNKAQIKLLDFIGNNGGTAKRSTILQVCFQKNKKAQEIDQIRDEMIASGLIEIKKIDQAEYWVLK